MRSHLHPHHMLIGLLSYDAMHSLHPHHMAIHRDTAYDAVSDVVESGEHWRSNFQIGSGVLKNCYRPNLTHIYGTQCDFMHRSC